MKTQVGNSIPLLDEIKLQAQVLVPVLRTLRKGIGKDKADALVAQALRNWVRPVCLRIGEQKSARLSSSSRGRRPS